MSENIEEKRFTHLHVHTQYSILDGASEIGALIDRALELGMNALAITDHGNMFGVKEFHNLASKKNIKPLIGCEIYITPKSRFDKTGSEDRSGHHLILIAKNQEGYRNLCRLVSLAWIEGFYYKPRIDWELLQRYHSGLIASSACLAGEIPSAILNGDLQKAEAKILEYKQLFQEDFYLELMRHKTGNPVFDNDTLAQQEQVNEALSELSKKLNVKLIATNDVHFIRAGDADAHERLLCINTGKTISDPTRLQYTKQEYLKSEQEMAELFPEHADALKNTAEIASKVEMYSLDQDAILPDFPLPEGFDNSDRYLEHLTWEGANERYPEINEEIKQRIDFELGVIEKMGFPGYFLIVHDFIRAAREMGVWVGPGRGSAAGSVVAYCLHITDVDPLRYGLLFERFLNPDRISMPDMDIDFDEDGREKVIRWVVDKYGKDRVAQIITFGTMASKMAIRDVARVQNLPLAEADRLAKLVPQKVDNLKKAIESVRELKDACESKDKLVSDTMKFAVQLEGSVRHTGIHACGVIIGKDPLIDHIPLSTAKDADLNVTQYEGIHVESVGLLKMDFLGLKTLSILKDAVENIMLSRNISIDINKVPLDDPETYELFSKGNTTAIFQFESDGMKKHLRELKPNRFEDLIAMNALYRPGPMDYIPSFIRRKHGKEKISYDLPDMEGPLKDTYGITVYQEQVMQLSMILAGFTRGEADTLRKAMGKKLKDVMAKMKEKFIEGCRKNGHNENVVQKIWSDWEAFAEYAFNKSHSACYAITAYRMAFIKAHYQSEFMAAVLSRNLSDIKEITFLIDECKRLGIAVLGPDINESQLRFTVNAKGEIRFGMAAIKGLGDAATDSVIGERTQNGPYKSIFDFLRRVNLRTVNRKSIEALAMAGAFDSLGIKRSQFFHRENADDTPYLEKLLRHIQMAAARENSMQQSLFGDTAEVDIPDPELPDCEEWNKLQMLKSEKEVIGFYMSGHPLDDYEIEINNFCNISLEKLGGDLRQLSGKDLKFAGMVTSVQHRTSKQNKPFGIFELEDFKGAHQFSLFSEPYLKFKHLLDAGSLVFIVARVEKRFNSEDLLEVRIQTMEPLFELLEKKAKILTLLVPLHQVNPDSISYLRKMAAQYPGKTEMHLRILDQEEEFHVDFLARKFSVDCSTLLKNTELSKFFRIRLN